MTGVSTREWGKGRAPSPLITLSGDDDVLLSLLAILLWNFVLLLNLSSDFYFLRSTFLFQWKISANLRHKS